MERASPRTSLNGSALLDSLAGLGLADVAVARPSFVEGMGQWLGWTDAIRLAAALQGPDVQAAGPAVDAAVLQRELDRVRSGLARAIEGPLPRTGHVARHDTDFNSHRRHYQVQQQKMEAAIAPLRARAREALSRRSPAAAQLAAIDKVMGEMLGVREQAVLARLPAQLQRRFESLRAAHGAESVAGPDAAPAWLAHFVKDMQRVLLAELDLRLQPVQGLVDALNGKQQGNDE